MDAKTYLLIAGLCTLFFVMNLVEYIIFGIVLGPFLDSLTFPGYSQMLTTISVIFMIALGSAAIAMLITYFVKKSQE